MNIDALYGFYLGIVLALFVFTLVVVLVAFLRFTDGR